MYITAHYDTTKDTNGIRDNGSGVVVAMEIARQLEKINPPLNVIFIFFSAEEAGLQGSAYFVSQLTREEKNNVLGCINIDVVGQKEDNQVALKTYSSQINVLSLLMDQYHSFPHGRSEASDHTSFYMGEIPAIYFADDIVSTKDTSDKILNEIDIEKLKDLTQLICDFIIDFDIEEYENLIKDSYTKEYVDLPETEEVINYSLVQVNKVLRENGAGSDIEYILKNDKGNQVTVVQEDSRFLYDELTNEIQSFKNFDDHVKYKVIIENDNIIVEYQDDRIGAKFYSLKGNISVNEALELLNNQGTYTKNGTLIYDFD